MHADGRPGEVEPVRDARGDVVFLVRQHHLELAELLDQVGPVHHVALEVRGVVHAGENADRAGASVGRMAAALEAFPAQLHEDALLRVHQLGFAWRDAEEGGVEKLHVVEHAAGLDVARIAGHGGRQTGVELGILEEGDAVAAGTQLVPELFDVGRAGEAARHRDHGDGFVPGLAVGLDAPGQAARVERHVGAIGGQRTGQRGRRGVAEEGVGRQACPTVARQIGEHAQHQQRVAAEVEKVVGTADPVKPERL